MSGGVIKSSIGILVGAPLMSASAAQVNTLPAGTARTLAGTAVGLQGVGLIGHTLGSMPKSYWKHK